MSGFNVILAPFNVRWEGSDNLSGDERNLTLICAYQMGRRLRYVANTRIDIRVSDMRISDGKAGYPGIRWEGAALRRWEGPDMRIPDGKALRCASQMGKHGQPVDKLGSR